MRALRNVLIAILVVLIMIAAFLTWKLLENRERHDDAITSETTVAVKETSEAASAEKGSWKSTDYGVPIYIPKNPDGDIFTKKLASSEMDKCDPRVNSRAPEDTRVEEIGDKYYLFTASDGPSKKKDGVLLGYSKTPAGAVTALYNAIVKVLPYSDDSSGEITMDESAEALFTISEERMKEFAASGEKLTDEDMKDGLYQKEEFGFPYYFHVLGCSADAVTIEFARAMSATSEPVVTSTSQLVWEDGDWKVNLDSKITGRLVDYDDVAGWTRWNVS